MSKQFSRRDFLKLTGVGAATTAILTGCGPASRYTKREPYMQMPEYTYNGLSTFYATTCRECAAGCGLIVRTSQGRALKTEGNRDNPLNIGKTCARGQATLQGLYNPDRVTGPMKGGSPITWDAATQVVADALKNNAPNEIEEMVGSHTHEECNLSGLVILEGICHHLNGGIPISIGRSLHTIGVI